MSTVYRIVPDEPLAGFGHVTETRDRELATKLAEQETEVFGVTHTVEEVHR